MPDPVCAGSIPATTRSERRTRSPNNQGARRSITKGEVMRPFVVEFTVRTVVMGDDENHAYSNAMDDWREIAGDSEPVIDVGGEVFSAKDLPSGWDLRCLPYGGDGIARLESIVAKATGSAA